jgi:hypothetical protein
MIASAWKIVRDRLEILEQKGIINGQVRSQLSKKPDLREDYFVTYDILSALIDALQARFSLLATRAGVHHPSSLETNQSPFPS